MTVPAGALKIACRGCRAFETRRYCTGCPVILRLVRKGRFATADRLMAAYPGLAAALHDPNQKEKEV